MKVQFINVGRNNFNATMQLKTVAAIRKEVKKHLLSRSVDFVYDEEKDEYAVLAGFHEVGTIKISE
jgi:hypothetical protein